MIFLSGSTNDALEPRMIQHGIGLLCSPDNGYHVRASRYDFVALDNGSYGLWQTERRFQLNFPLQGQMPQVCLWTSWMTRLTDFIPADRVLFCTVPDVVAQAEPTLDLFRRYGDRPRQLGYKNALVAQNGLELLRHRLDWSALDCLFIGGDDAWKLGPEAAALAKEAKEHGKHVHVGRVNSLKRMLYAMEIGADSCDGNLVAVAPETNFPRLVRMLAACQTARQQPRQLPLTLWETRTASVAA